MSSEPSGQASSKSRRLRIGKYEVLSHIATGGMGAVYQARDSESGRLVALKVLAPEAAGNPVMLTRFRREAAHATKVQHDHIVRLYECGQANGVYFLALEFVEGVDLYEYITRKRQLGIKESRELMIQAAQALDHLHGLGIVHRDIKPSNFLVTSQGSRPWLKLIDLGLAREARDEEFRLTRASYTLGTVDYMAPEQARDSGSADIRSDIYALGCTWYSMLAGRPPFASGSLTERILAHAEDEPPDIRKYNPRVPRKVVQMLQRMLAKHPDDRYQTPAELLEDLNYAPEEANLSERDLISRLAAEDDWTTPAGKDVATPAKPRSSSESSRPATPAARPRSSGSRPVLRAREPVAAEEPSGGFYLSPLFWAAVGVGLLAIVLLWMLADSRRQQRHNKDAKSDLVPAAISRPVALGRPAALQAAARPDSIHPRDRTEGTTCNLL